MNCFAFPRLILHSHTEICLWALAQCFFISSSPSHWELVTWKEEVFWQLFKWDVSLHKLTISKMSPWKQQRLNNALWKGKAKNLQPFRLPSVASEIWLCTSWEGHVFFHTFRDTKNCGGKFFSNSVGCHLLDWSHRLHSQGHQAPLKVTPCFSSA